MYRTDVIQASSDTSMESYEIQRRKQLLSLNQDVLSIIIFHLSYPDALALSSTCRAARALSLDPALRVVVLDRSSEQLTKFRDFLLDNASRPLFLRSLTITKTVTWDVDPSSKDLAAALAEVLERSVRLEHLSCGAIRDFVAADRRVKENLVALTQVKGLTLLDGGPEMASIMAGLKSPDMEQLTVDMLRHDQKVPFEEFFDKLRRYRRLESLCISRMFSRIVAPAPLTLDQISTAPIPSLHTLALHTTYLPLSLATALFPNVSDLTFTNARHFPNFGHPSPPPADSAPGASWPTLDTARIDARDLAVWPLASRTRVLDLDVLRSGYSREAIAAVTRMDPRVLTVAYTIDADNLFWVRLPVIATDLRFLDVRLLELSGHRRRYMLMHLERFPALTVLFLCVRAFYQPPDARAEIAALARDLALSNTQLKFIGISFIDGRSTREDEPVWEEERLGSTWFVVRRREINWEDVDDRGVDVGEIPTAVGLQVREYMYEAKYDAPGWEEPLASFA